MIRVGYWRSSAEPNLPDPSAFVDPNWDPQTRAFVIDYLNQGLVRASYRGMSICRICRQWNGSRDLTDGVYVWPEGLAHYLESHHVRLPDVFVVHASNTVRK